MKVFYTLLAVLSCSGCSFYGSINLKKHEFAKQPQKIIWLHFAGFDEEHISLLKFFYSSTKQKTSFENALCFGKTWRYNLYQLRPDHYSSFLSQAMGTQNITQTCKDYNSRPMWSYLAERGYQTGILEKVENPKYSLIHSRACHEKNFLKDTILWRMQPGKGGNTFHAEERTTRFDLGKVYNDKSCHKDGCYNNLLTNIRAIMEKGHFKGLSRFAFIVRDNSLSQYLIQKKLDKVKSYLLEIERVFEYFVTLQKNNSDMLVFLSTSESLPIELPKRGKGWRNLAQGKNNLIYRRPSLLSPVWAIGVRAENYCGIYEEAEILRRTLNNFTPQRMHILNVPVM